jgi:hypothetical protein
MTDDTTIINTEDVTQDFDRVRVTPCDPTSPRSHTHIACAYEEIERNVFAEAVDVCLNDYDAVRAIVCRSVGVPAHRIEWERDSLSPDPV